MGLLDSARGAIIVGFRTLLGFLFTSVLSVLHVAPWLQTALLSMPRLLGVEHQLYDQLLHYATGAPSWALPLGVATLLALLWRLTLPWFLDPRGVLRRSAAQGSVTWAVPSLLSWVPSSDAAQAIVIAVREGQTEVVQSLLLSGTSPDSSDSAGRSALMWAARSGDTPMAKLLLEASASVDRTDAEGFTALTWAARHGCTPVVALLLNSGADIEHKDRRGATAYIWAIAFAQRQAPHCTVQTDPSCISYPQTH